VNVVRPCKKLPFWTLVTSGMSDLAMTIPKGISFPERIELAICLPPEWPLSMTDDRWKETEFFWPIGELKSTAIYPHLYQTWLGPGHSIRGGDEVLAGGRFEGHLIRRLSLLPDEFACCKVDDGAIEIFGLIPLLPEEMSFKLRRGLGALLERMDAAGITELLDPKRKAVCPAQ
jgi:Suppressor of fused protein (SUFU)